jgi:hypothetical protein
MVSMKNSFKEPLGALGLYLLVFGLFWPGMMTADSQTQYNQVLSKVFNSHHPVLMGVVWSYVNKVVSGPGLMFFLHNILLWAGIIVLWHTFDRLGWKGKRLFLLLPFWPIVFAYSQIIWKDVGFTHSYFLATALLIRWQGLQLRPSPLALGGLLALLIYGTGVKYQAQYLLPIYGWWLASLFIKASLIKRTLAMGLVTLSIIGINKEIERHFISEKNNSHSWQMAKLYDLAGISYFQKRPIFPDYIVKSPFFSMDQILEKYTPSNVDDLIYGPKAPLFSTQSSEQLEDLWTYWMGAVQAYPGSYMKHRLDVWLKLMNRKPDNYYYCLEHHGDQLAFRKIADPVGYYYLSLIPSILTRFYWMIVLFIMALAWRKESIVSHKMKAPLGYLCLIGFSQTGIYVFLSMASDLRYVYLANLVGLSLIPFLYHVKKTEGCNASA